MATSLLFQVITLLVTVQRNPFNASLDYSTWNQLDQPNNGTIRTLKEIGTNLCSENETWKLKETSRASSPSPMVIAYHFSRHGCRDRGEDEIDDIIGACLLLESWFLSTWDDEPYTLKKFPH